MHGAGDQQGSGDAEAFGNGEQAGAAIEVHVLTSVEDVEAADPEGDGGTKDQHAQIEMAGDGDPGGGGRDAERKAEKKMRPSSETLGEGIKKKNGESKRSKVERERVEPPRGEEENGDGGQREKPGETHGERTGGQSTLGSAGIRFVEAEIDDAV